MSEQKLLPIGSIVILKDGKKKIMIYGRKQKMKNSGQIFDYLGCLYPEGYINPAYSFVFNHEQIVEVIFKGFVNEEEEAFVEEVLSKVDQSPEKVPVKEELSIEDWK